MRRKAKRKQTISLSEAKAQLEAKEQGRVVAQKTKKSKKAKQRPEDMPLVSETLRLEIEGFNQPRLLSALSAEGIHLTAIAKRSPKVLRVNVAKKDSKKTFAILERLCYTYTVVQSSGLSRLAQAAVRRIGLVLGLIACLVLLTVSQGYIWRVELTGYDKVSEQVLLTTLAEHNVKRGGAKRSVNPDAVKNALNAVEGVLETTVQIVGTTVKVTVMETTDFMQPDTGSETDILSQYDAEITRIVTKQGTTLVKTGQRVFKGTPLIGAYRLDEEGNVDGPVNAKGVVYGRVAFTDTVTFSTTEYILKPTGKTYKSTILSLFGLKIGKKKNPFEHFTAETETIHAFSGTFLPIKVTRDIVREMEYTAIEYDPNERAEQLTRESVLKTVIQCGGSEISTDRTLQKIGDGLYALHIFTQAEMPIGQA